MATLTVRIAGWVFSVSVESASGPSKHRRLSEAPWAPEPWRRWPSAASASSNVGARNRIGVGERAAHADLLRALSGKMNAIM